MATHSQAKPELPALLTSSPWTVDTGDSSSDTPVSSRASSVRFRFGGSMGRIKRGSVDYSSATDVEVGYSSAASNTTFIPPYMNHGQRFVSPTLYEQGSVSPQGPIATTQSMHSPEYTISPAASNGVANNNTTNGAPPTVAQNSSAAAYRRAPSSTPPVSLACTECRHRHLKCDAGVPTCGRCRAERRTCLYVKSRRGWKGRKRKGSTTMSEGMTSGTETSAYERGESGNEGGYVASHQLFYLFLWCFTSRAGASLLHYHFGSSHSITTPRAYLQMEGDSSIWDIEIGDRGERS
ncbi:hypothetical protein BDZ91DRAFT_768928 [Kalaharituber pfeilii]|nr:hypothetical protein BDZ91DRAFT_768928 [Kalaharituber pfeilii]